MEPVTRHQRLDFFVASDESWWVALGTTRSRSGVLEGGMIQTHDVHNEESKLFAGKACCICETKVYDKRTALLARADCTTSGKLSLNIHSIATSSDGHEQLELVDVSIDLLDPNDTPLRVFSLEPLPIVSVITGFRSIYFFELHTGALLYSIETPSPAVDLFPVRYQGRGGRGFYCYDRNGTMRWVSVNEKDLIGWVRRVLKDDTLASAIAIRTGLPGAEDVILDDMFRNYHPFVKKN